MTPRRILVLCVPDPRLSRHLFPLPLALCTSGPESSSPRPSHSGERRASLVPSVRAFERQLAVTLFATHRHGQTELTTGHASPPHYDPHDARRTTHTLCRDRMRRRVKKRYVVSHGYDMVFLPVNPLFTLPLRDQIASSLQCTSIVDFVRFNCTFNANWWLWFKSWLPKPRVGMPCDPVHTLNLNHSIKV